MTPEQAAAFHAAATGCDSRLQPLTPISAKVWAHHLRDIPYRETEHLLTHIYSAPVLVTLQPGHVTEAWESLKAERRRIIDRIRSIDRYLAATGETDPGVLAEKLEARARYVAELPEHVVTYAGVAERQLNPPRKYPREEQAAEIIDFSKALKRPA